MSDVSSTPTIADEDDPFWSPSPLPRRNRHASKPDDRPSEGPIGIAQPELEKHGLGYIAHLPLAGVRIAVESLRRGRDGLSADLTIEIGPVGGEGEWVTLTSGRIALASLSGREHWERRLAKREGGQREDLEKRGRILDGVCAAVLRAEHRVAEPAIYLRDAQDPPPGVRVLPPLALANLPTLWFGADGTLKSYGALAAGLSIHTGLQLLGIAAREPGRGPVADAGRAVHRPAFPRRSLGRGCSRRRCLGEQLGEEDWLVAVRAEPASPAYLLEEVAVGAAADAQVTLLALGALIDLWPGRWRRWLWLLGRDGLRVAPTVGAHPTASRAEPGLTGGYLGPTDRTQSIALRSSEAAAPATGPICQEWASALQCRENLGRVGGTTVCLCPVVQT